MPKSISSATLRNKYQEVSEECRTSGEPFIVTSQGEADLVVMSVAAYEKLAGAQPETSAHHTPTADDIMASIFSPAEPSKEDKRQRMMDLDQEAARRSAEIDAMDVSDEEKALLRDEMSKWYSRSFKEIANS